MKNMDEIRSEFLTVKDQHNKLVEKFSSSGHQLAMVDHCVPGVKPPAAISTDGIPDVFVPAVTAFNEAPDADHRIAALKALDDAYIEAKRALRAIESRQSDGALCIDIYAAVHGEVLPGAPKVMPDALLLAAMDLLYRHDDPEAVKDILQKMADDKVPVAVYFSFSGLTRERWCAALGISDQTWAQYRSKGQVPAERVKDMQEVALRVRAATDGLCSPEDSAKLRRILSAAAV